LVSKIEGFGETEKVAVTVLVDNTADLIVKSTETVIRFQDEALLAEHGFAALVDLQGGETRILWDAGLSEIALPENMRRMKIDPTTINVIALSHGHGDHTGAMTDIIRAMGRRPEGREWDPDASMDEILEWVKGCPVPLVAHPAAFRERWGIDEDGRKHGPHTCAHREEWEAAGAQIVLSEGPHRLGPGCWTTGAVPRLSFETAGRSGKRFYRDGDRLLPDDLADDQTIVINVKGKGLVVVTGCAHSGIVNTVNYAREISGVDRVWAILGGFHLAPASDKEIRRTIEEIRQMKPVLVVPTHCSGFRAISQFARQMPQQFVLGVVGTTYLF
jgi:7,8-dihydropterin-6-yl-methyl-4-(beta-D-ribofuranosyl)aminobenzene 5'-phosphate synthase